ncbi:MAG: hypothetical protein GF313_15810 [Caldithrix sp.]|nr:hypothetical protein [Caldithrix sp.]
MADEIKNSLPYAVNLIKGSGGIFDIYIDNDLIFSKHQSGRFPLDGEVVEALQKRDR